MYSLIYYFITVTLPIIILFVGVLGNTIVIAVLMRPKFKKISSRKILCVLSHNDTLSITTILIYHGSAFDFNFITQSLAFFYYEFAEVAGWAMCLVNIERLISIRYSQLKVFVDNRSFSLILLVLYGWNFGIYFARTLQVTLFDGFTGRIVTNFTDLNDNDSIICDVYDPQANFIYNMIDLNNSTIVPFLLMIVSSILIIKSIYDTRKRLLINHTIKDMRRFKRDLQFSITILVLDLFYFAFNLPYCLYSFLGDPLNDFMFTVMDMIFYTQYIFNILAYVILNSEFQKELLVMLHILKAQSKTDLFSLFSK